MRRNMKLDSTKIIRIQSTYSNSTTKNWDRKGLVERVLQGLQLDKNEGSRAELKFVRMAGLQVGWKSLGVRKLDLYYWNAQFN